MKTQVSSKQLPADSRQWLAGSGSACCLLAAACLLLLATALRFYRLDAQDLWGDEAFSVWLSQQPLSSVIAGAADTHPPFYPLLLFFWLRLVGASAFATRALSAFIGILVVPLIFVFAGRLAPARPRVGWLAAILAAASPLLIYYSQETRMYELATLLALGSTYFALCLVTPSTPRGVGRISEFVLRTAAYLVWTALALYTHYSAFFVLAAQNLFAALRFRRDRAALMRWAILQAALVTAYIPWIVVQSSFLRGKASARFDEWGWRGVEMIFGKTFLAFSIGLTLEFPLAQIATAIFLTFAALGVIAAVREGASDRSPLLAPLYFITPVVIAYLVNPVMPFFFERYVLVALPAFCVTVALGVDWFARAAGRVIARTHAAARYVQEQKCAAGMSRGQPARNGRAARSTAAEFLGSEAKQAPNRELEMASSQRTLLAMTIGATGALALLSALSLWNYYFDDAYVKGKYGQMMAYVAAHAQPGDALVLNNPLQKPLYRYYAPRGIPAFFLPDGAPLEDPQTRRQLEDVARSHARLWLVMFGNPAEYDPTGYLERWLGAHAFKSFSRGFVDAHLSLYVMPSAQTAIQQPLRMTLGENIQLVGYALDRAQVAPGETLLLTLHWQLQSPISNLQSPISNLQSPISTRYTVFTHLIGAINPATQSPLWSQMDSEPVGGARPTTTWQIGETIEDRYGLQIPLHIPPGEYLLEVGMYDATTLARLPVFDENGKRVAEDRVVLGAVRVK